jgi:hypothetical protein
MGCREAESDYNKYVFLKASNIHRIKEKRDCLKNEYGNVRKDKEYKCVLFTLLHITVSVILSSHIPFYCRHIPSQSQ